jgi:hypothetical protein
VRLSDSFSVRNTVVLQTHLVLEEAAATSLLNYDLN